MMAAKDTRGLLERTLARARLSPFYRDRLAGISLRSTADLPRVPLTTKEDLRRASPHGLLCVERAGLRQYHESFGTTGMPVSTWYTQEDLRDNVRALAGLGVNFGAGDIVLIRFPYAISSIAHLMHAAAQSRGACVIPASSRTNVSPYPRVIELLRKLEVTVLACLPQQALLIAEAATLLGMAPERDFPSLRALCTAGEPLPPGQRGLLEQTWGVPVFDNYGLTECGAVAVDCAFGRCHPVEDAFFLEILGDDLATPAAPGGIGWLVLTTLKRRAAPLVRYLTGDRAVLADLPCPCGRRTVLQVRGRGESRVDAGVRRLDLWDLDEIVSALPSRRFWAAGPAPGGLRLIVEEDEPGRLTAELTKELEARFGLRLQIEAVPPGTLCDRSTLLDVGQVGKPRYTFSAEEMAAGVHLGSA